MAISSDTGAGDVDLARLAAVVVMLLDPSPGLPPADDAVRAALMQVVRRQLRDVEQDDLLEAFRAAPSVGGPRDALAGAVLECLDDDPDFVRWVDQLTGPWQVPSAGAPPRAAFSPSGTPTPTPATPRGLQTPAGTGSAGPADLMDVESIDLEALRRQARQQSSGRLGPQAAWVLAFEDETSRLLLSRVALFRRIMRAAGNPGLENPGDPQPGPRGWLIGLAIETWHRDGWGEPRPAACSVAVTADDEGFHLAYADLVSESAPISRRPDRSRVGAGEIREFSALGEAAAEWHRRRPELDPRDAAAAFAADCDRHMLALLCAHELTFPDRDLGEVAWSEDEQYLIIQAERRREETRPPPEMSDDQVIDWIEGGDTGTGYALPVLTGEHLAALLVRTSVPLMRPRRKNWLGRMVPRDPVWQIGRQELERSETSVTTRYTYLRPDGSGYTTTASSGWSYSEEVVEHAVHDGSSRRRLLPPAEKLTADRTAVERRPQRTTATR